MAEKKAVGHAYNIDFLNVVFAASSIFLFLSTIWMVWDDFDRDWKNTQRQFVQLESEVTRQLRDQAARGVYTAAAVEFDADAEQQLTQRVRNGLTLGEIVVATLEDREARFPD